MDVVSFGGGTNSTAMIIGMHLHRIPIDLILFADTGGEQPHTYEFIGTFNGWLKAHGLPEIVPVGYHDRDGNRLTLEQECLHGQKLPAIAYGFKQCSLKHKIGTQEKFCNNYQPCKDVWAEGEKVNKYIGYDAGETRRIQHAVQADEANKKYVNHYPLYEWGLTPEEVAATKSALMGKSVAEITEFDGVSVDRMKELAKADKDGRVLVLPRKVGDTVYEVQTIRKRIQPLEIISVCIGRMGEPFFYWELKDGLGIYQNVRGFDFSQLGKTVFLSREEAEQALEEAKGDGRIH